MDGENQYSLDSVLVRVRREEVLTECPFPGTLVKEKKMCL
jgi:hypothetical protein